jgi:excisionase family DNA binding protein
MPRRSEAELTETGRLFRAKLRQLREQERPRERRAKRRSPARRSRIDIASVESPPGDDEVLGPLDVGRLLGVHPKTVARWATNDGLPSFRTVGGHRRFRWADVTASAQARRRPRARTRRRVNAKSGRPSPCYPGLPPSVLSLARGAVGHQSIGGMRPACEWAETPGRYRTAWPKSGRV